MRTHTSLSVLSLICLSLGSACTSRSYAEAPKEKAAVSLMRAPVVVENSGVSTNVRTLNRAGARTAVAAVIAEATRRGVGAVVSVVDEGGHLIAAERVDGTFTAGAHVSEGKARTAAEFKRPTAFFEKIIREGRTPMVALDDDFTPLQGGVPIEASGQVIGAVGVSGASSAAEDEELAIFGVNAVLAALGQPGQKTPEKPVTYLGHDEVMRAFERGRPLLEASGYKVHASRREAPGQAEIHTHDTDIIYVLGGKATLVTGGRALDVKETEANELRGSRIEGGESRTLVPGDVIVVPNGVPHWFKSVDGAFTYYVVKAG